MIYKYLWYTLNYINHLFQRLLFWNTSQKISNQAKQWSRFWNIHFIFQNLQNSEVYLEIYIVGFKTNLTERLISKHIFYISKSNILPSNKVLNYQKFIQIPIHPPLGIYLPSFGTNKVSLQTPTFWVFGKFWTSRFRKHSELTPMFWVFEKFRTSKFNKHFEFINLEKINSLNP